MKRVLLSTVVFMALLVSVGRVHLPATIDREGFWRNPTLLDLFAPSVEGAYRATLVRSIQVGSIDMNGVTTKTATITAVTTSNAILYYNGQSSVASTSPKTFARLALTNATTVTCNVNASAGALPVFYTVTEFYPGVITSIQVGTITLNGSAIGTSTITSVLVAKSAVVTTGFTFNDVTFDASFIPNTVLASATTVATTTVAAPSFAVIAAFQVVQFK